MFSAVALKSGMFENRDGGVRRTIARRLNRQARRRNMAHVDYFGLDSKRNHEKAMRMLDARERSL